MSKNINIDNIENATKDIPEFSLCGLSLIGKVVELYDADTCKIVLPLQNTLLLV